MRPIETTASAPDRIDSSASLGTGRILLRALDREDMESKMDDVASKIVEILKKHMKKPKDDIGLQTPLSDLEIESLDLAMIVFDIEDSFAIQIPYNANEDTSDFKTVGSVVERVRGLVGAKGAAA